MMKVYALYDRRAEMYVGGLLLFAANAAAIRTLEDEVARHDTNLGRHPEDFDLMHVGDWDPADGALRGQESYNPTLVVNAGTLVAQTALEGV